eukprot:CAMPEP_0181231306 /NCGR_PEP_ID=MMETSP1096-20121128/35021_1 /TAXON_ID=156174 ORGANISM="Chrysochromulina ericina, Strain CCMP281" /NCGR_SAMPLE_ID=MMETSP1096 /ASSEMBLY_ACC=CAM_ASM_000453 /LENGTH=39 /DNA_ID= /DNA_START= /DNA_END= /DNA_ORIENTATION=
MPWPRTASDAQLAAGGSESLQSAACQGCGAPAPMCRPPR